MLKYIYILIAGLFVTSLPTAYGQAWKQLAAGAEFSAALNSDGSLYTWGFNGNGQLGQGLPFGARTNVPELITGSDWNHVSCGAVHAIAIKNDGSVWGWGSNVVFQLGDNTTINRNLPTRIGTENNWKTIASGQAHNLAIKEDGSLWGWGFNIYGQVGNGSTVNVTSPVNIGSDKDWIAVACGGAHSLALKADGSLYAWGANFNGQLGIGSNELVLSPRRVGTASWLKIDAGFEFSAGIQTDGSLWSWGFNGNGQLGDGTLLERNSPLRINVTNINTWASLSCGSAFMHIIASEGTLWATGANIEGCLGLQDLGPNVLRPEQVGSDNDWSTIQGATGFAANNSVFGFHTLGMKTNKDVICVAGANYIGQLGTSDEIPRNVFECVVLPVTVSVQTITDQRDFANVFPNPFNDVLNIEFFNIAGSGPWRILDARGNIVESGFQVNDFVALSTAHWIPGLYLLQVQQGVHLRTVRLIKK